MDQTSMDLLTERVDRLERENRRWRRGSLLALLGIGVLALGAAGRERQPRGGFVAEVPHVIETEKLVIKDKDGKARMELGPTEDFPASLRFFDQEGNARISLSLLSEDMAALSFWDHEKKNRINLGLFPERTATLNFSDPEGNPTVSLGADSQSGRLSFRDREGKSRSQFSIRPDGGLSLYLYDPEQRPRLGFYLNREGSPHLRLFDKGGKAIIKLSAPVAPTTPVEPNPAPPLVPRPAR